MRRSLFGVTATALFSTLALQGAFGQESTAQGPDPAPPARSVQVAQAPSTAKVTDCKGVSPYDHYECLDAYLGSGFFERLANYYKLEWGQAGPPSDPNAPPSRRDGWPATPETSPPMPFTEWPYGGSENIGVNRSGSVDSPLMVALGNTGIGNWMNSNGLQVYGWVDPGFNVSNMTQKPGGNAPAAYDYTPNRAQLDQLVLYIERTADTVQTDHISWGFRISGLYGENYRYTTSYGLASNQLLKRNDVMGYDFPMLYVEAFIPQIAEGMLVRVGRFISLPDIEAQLAPNNYMYTHSMTYSYDNYTNTGIQTTTAITKNFFIQLGLVDGTEAPLWHVGKKEPNLDPNPLFPNPTFPKDPGARPSITGCFRYNFNDGKDNINGCADAINAGNWGYNNLQWYGFTAYHKFNDHWHISYEFYDEHQNNVLNQNNPAALAAYLAGGTPFSPQYIPFNSPFLAQCKSATVFSCKAEALGTVAYINYSPEPMDNFSFRPEFYDDKEGQRTGTKTRYVTMGLGWQHWLSPQIELRPEVTWYKSLDAPAFNGNPNAGIPPDRHMALIGSGDIIIHW